MYDTKGPVHVQGSFPSALATASNLTVLDISSNMLRHARGIPPFQPASGLQTTHMLSIVLVLLRKGPWCLAVAAMRRVTLSNGPFQGVNWVRNQFTSGSKERCA